MSPTQLISVVRAELKTRQVAYDKSEDDLKALQSTGQIVGEVLRQLDEDRCSSSFYFSTYIVVIVKASSGPRYVVGCRTRVEKKSLKPGTRVALDMTTLTIMRNLPREVDPLVFNMLREDPGNIAYGEIGGLGEEIRQLREVHIYLNISLTLKVVELPLTNPELFLRVGINPPKGVLLYGPPGTGKTRTFFILS